MTKRKHNSTRKKEKPGSRNVDLQFFLQPPKPKRGLDDKAVRTFVRLAKRGFTNDKIAKEMKVSSFTICQLRAELKRAALKKYDLKTYLAEGRPLRYGNKVLAK